MKKLYLFLCACLAVLVGCSPAMASEFILTLPEGAPDWLVSIFVLFVSICGVVSKIDAHIPEDFKAKLPGWVRAVWDFFGGNYLRSKNQDSH
ncbi:hypothetical protein [Vibrio europaeus]|uniref:hypothetical protein n=1 Tax=Vibrio europaeus TaxID=300876 RepID=UPI00233F5E01|nr:hypothetical protein [Vibrio europaeus]MDC5753610.1 hypothetical protein [Vibrio europaeus]MDC5816477.1 hypothetical protein [Vibrio europaeus]